MPRYIVIVHDPPPEKPRPGTMTSSVYTVATPPRVSTVTASSVHDAVSKTSVPAGGHCLVVDEKHARRFDKAKEAPLVEKAPDGRSMPEAA